MADLFAASSKTLMLGCASLLVGIVVLRGYLLPRAPHHHPPRRWVIALASVLIVISVLDMLWRIRSVLGFVTPELALNYLQNTRHGTAVLWRSGLVILLTATLLQHRLRGWTFALMSSAAAGILYTFSAISHAAAMGGLPETLLDWTHFVAASAWAGGLLALVLFTTTTSETPEISEISETFVASINRLSRLGLAAVIVLMLSGIASARLHVDSATVLTGTSYGRALLVKNALVLLTLAIAGANRWLFLPAAKRLQATHTNRAASTNKTNNTNHSETQQKTGARALLTALRYEAMILIAVLAATGWLTTQPMPHN